jgi:hypothetical protein
MITDTSDNRDRNRARRPQTSETIMSIRSTGLVAAKSDNVRGDSIKVIFSGLAQKE